MENIARFHLNLHLLEYMIRTINWEHIISVLKSINYCVIMCSLILLKAFLDIV